MKLHILEGDSEQEAPFYVTDVPRIRLQSIHYLVERKNTKTLVMIRPELEFPN